MKLRHRQQQPGLDRRADAARATAAAPGEAVLERVDIHAKLARDPRRRQAKDRFIHVNVTIFTNILGLL
jgi:hypothetical protein